MEEAQLSQHLPPSRAPSAATMSSSSSTSSSGASSSFTGFSSSSTSQATSSSSPLQHNVSSMHLQKDEGGWLLVFTGLWFLVFMIGIHSIKLPVHLQLGPNSSFLVQDNSIFVQSIKVQEMDERKPGLMFYGFYKLPPLDVDITWTESHNLFVPANCHKEWMYYLNKGSRVEISYNISYPSLLPLYLVIAQGNRSLQHWINFPSESHATLCWNTVHGSGKIKHEISEPPDYYIAVGNTNLEDVEIQMNFSIGALVHNTTKADYKCSVSNHLCRLTTSLSKENAVVLTSPNFTEGTHPNYWKARLSFEPRYFIIFLGSGVLPILVFTALLCCNMFQPHTRDQELSPLLLGENN